MNIKKQARIQYNKERDEYALMLSTDGGKTWGFSLGCRCQRREGESPDAEPMFVSIELIEEMKRSILNGFEIVY